MRNSKEIVTFFIVFENRIIEKNEIFEFVFTRIELVYEKKSKQMDNTISKEIYLKKIFTGVGARLV